jgi:hypothetical protein
MQAAQACRLRKKCSEASCGQSYHLAEAFAGTESGRKLLCVEHLDLDLLHSLIA